MQPFLHLETTQDSKQWVVAIAATWQLPRSL